MADTEQTRELAAIRDTLVAAHQNHGHVFVGIGLARAVLASSWLAARDERIRADEREKLAGKGGWLCSQCGEMPSVMVKIGTPDGWCANCLNEAAAGEVEAQ